MTPVVTHFEIYGEAPRQLAGFYRDIFGWEVEQMPAVDYWRIQPGKSETHGLNGGLTYRAIPGLNGWMIFINVASVEETAAKIEELGGTIVRPKTAVPRTAWVTIVSDPAKNYFGIWEADATAMPIPEPD